MSVKDEGWKKNFDGLKFFSNKDQKSVLEVLELNSFSRISSSYKKDYLSKIRKSVNDYKLQPTTATFFLFLADLTTVSKLDKPFSLQKNSLPDFLIADLLHQLDDELKSEVTITCLNALLYFQRVPLPPILDQLLRFLVPLDSGLEIAKFLNPLFSAKLSLNQQVASLQWILQQHELAQLPIINRENKVKDNASTSEKMNWVASWLDVLSKNTFKIKSPFLSLHIDENEGQKKDFAKATIQVPSKDGKSYKIESSLSLQATYVLSALILWELFCLDFLEESLSGSWPSTKRFRMPVCDLEILNKKLKMIKVSDSDKFSNALNRVKTNINGKFKSAILESNPSLVATTESEDIFLVEKGFCWINTAKRPTATTLHILSQEKTAAPDRAKRSNKKKS